MARLAETGREVRLLATCARRPGSASATLQRMFLQYAGVSPTWVIRRYRLLEAAEAVREGAPVSWAEVAAEPRLRRPGPPDHRDFRAATGQTPAAYAQAQQRRLQ